MYSSDILVKELEEMKNIYDLAINSNMMCVAPESEDKPYPYPVNQKLAKKKKETSMNYASAAIVAPAVDKTDRDQRNHLLYRLDDVRYTKKSAARETFKINDDEAPSNPKELAQRIADGKFTIKNADSDTSFGWRDWSCSIQWRSEPADEAGYKEFKSALSTKHQAAVDIIKVLPVAEGLKALQEFEEWEFTAPTVH